MKIRKPLLLVVLIAIISFSVNAQVKSASGVYESPFGKFTIGISNGILTGFYENYGSWDSELKTYMRQDVFYIYGTTRNGINYDIISGTPGFPGENMKGKLSFEVKETRFKIRLNDVPPTGCGFDISEDSEKNYFPLKDTLSIIGVAYIKSRKAPLYTYENGTFSQKKAYLVYADKVLIKVRKGLYTKIGYRILNTNRYKDYWLRTTDLQDPSPTLWGDF